MYTKWGPTQTARLENKICLQKIKSPTLERPHSCFHTQNSFPRFSQKRKAMENMFHIKVIENKLFFTTTSE